GKRRLHRKDEVGVRAGAELPGHVQRTRRMTGLELLDGTNVDVGPAVRKLRARICGGDSIDVAHGVTSTITDIPPSSRGDLLDFFCPPAGSRPRTEWRAGLVAGWTGGGGPPGPRGGGGR